jgi:metalloendopeptidase OMA1, mitochondrial
MGPFGSRGAGGVRRGGGVRWWVILAFGAYMAYYWFSNQQESSFTGRKQLVDVSIQDEVALGLQAYREVLSQSNVLTTGDLPKQVEEIARRLIEVGPKVEQYMQQTHGVQASVQWDAFEWAVSVLESDEINAFCLPGGKIAVYTGIIPVAQNADALAVIMGHEIAHALLRHGAERMAQQKLVQIGAMAASVSLGDMDPQQQRMVMAALGAGAQYGILLPFSRDHESEGDHIGLMLAAAACFDPRESIGLWERMGEAASARGGAPPEFMSSHPSHATRIQQLQSLIPEALQLREQMGCPPLTTSG